VDLKRIINLKLLVIFMDVGDEAWDDETYLWDKRDEELKEFADSFKDKNLFKQSEK